MIDYYDLNRLVKSGQLKQLASCGYQLPKGVTSSGIKIKNEIYHSSYISCSWYYSSSKLYLLLTYSFYREIYEFSLNSKILKSLEQLQKTKIKTLNIKFRYLKLVDKIFYYTNPVSVIKA